MAGYPKVVIVEVNAQELGFNQEATLELVDVIPLTASNIPTYTGDLLTRVVYYREGGVTNTYRVAQADITYDSEDFPQTSVCTLYNTTDGTLLIKTITITYTRSGDTLTGITRVIT